eukprot:scaffold1504_cov417-Prasinococcus_capsulatus_cf.AAC.2
MHCCTPSIANIPRPNCDECDRGCKGLESNGASEKSSKFSNKEGDSSNEHEGPEEAIVAARVRRRGDTRKQNLPCEGHEVH